MKKASFRDLPRGLFVPAALIVALGLRLSRLFSSLEYDELWTLENFVPRDPGFIFTRLALPNNHPLYTLFIKMTGFSPECYWSIRLLSLIAGLGTLLLLRRIAELLWPENGAKDLVLLFGAVSAPLIAYSALARGYALQLFLLSGFWLALLQMRRRYLANDEKAPPFPELAAAATGVLSELTLPTSVIYLFLPALVFTMTALRERKTLSPEGKKRQNCAAASLAALAAFTLFWYLRNFDEFVEASKWGVPLSGGAEFFHFVLRSSWELAVPAGLVAGAMLLGIKNANARMLSVLIVLFWASALFTHAGPSRSYLPVAGCSLLLLAFAAAEIVRRARPRHAVRGTLFVLFALCAAAYLDFYTMKKHYRQTDSFAVAETMIRLPADVIPLAGAAEGYPLSRHGGQALPKDYRARLEGSPRRIFMVPTPLSPAGEVEGVEAGSGKTAGLPLHVPPGSFAPLVPQNRDMRKGEIVFLVFQDCAHREMAEVLESMYKAGSPVVLLNPWLTLPHFRGGEKRYSALAAFRVPEDRPAPESPCRPTPSGGKILFLVPEK